MASQDLQNRNKILQELHEKKKLLGQHSGTSAPFLPGSKSHENPRNPNESHQLALNQRQALEHANSMSWGFFITQDSLHGNLILPVIPRYDPD